jgi:16S rRNA (cytidine1402-2'-O)-methyltransferase
MAAASASLYLVPNTLDFGAPGTLLDLQELLPLGVIRVASRLDHWIVENARTARAFLKRVDAVVPLARALQDISIVELPRRLCPGAARSTPPDTASLLEPALRGADIGLLSEAGLPGVADPGATLVAAAHGLGVTVVALPGASSLTLAIAASGLNGQSFAFVGYLPTEAQARATRIRELEALSRRHQQTQLMIETPYRNAALLAALCEHLQPTSHLAVSCGLTLATGFNRSAAIADWRARPARLPDDVPVVFAVLAP